ncbi:MAG: hypothetical protein K0R39_1463 [Symbiobacteriaceae bacterium]|jgi:sigma54-dependent transcription regulator|nr:hypothetical protein [Symbiobacteriaceae bacterium]
MTATSILTEMHQVLADQIEHVVAGNHRELLAGVARHEYLLAALRTAQIDAPSDEIRALADKVEREKEKLHSLLTAQNQRVDFMLRLLLGGGQPARGGYPGRGLGHDTPTPRLNRRA